MYKTPKKETPYKGSSINHVRDQFLGIFAPPLLHSWSFLLNNTYEIDMSFGYPPSLLNCPRGVCISHNQEQIFGK